MAEPDWATAIQLEQCRTAKISALMQAIMAVPMFDGAAGELEFFIKRMDLIVEQINTNPLDQATNNYILGYFYSRVALDVLMEIGVSCDTSWEDVKKVLREKYGGAARSIPRLILREMLIQREKGESAATYAKEVLKGFRKISNRIKDGFQNKEEVRIRILMLEELATETLTHNLPRRIRHWVKVEKPTSLEQLVKTVEDEEVEEREERWEEPRRKNQRLNVRDQRSEDNWRTVTRKNRDSQGALKIQNRDSYGAKNDRRWNPKPKRKERARGLPKGSDQGCWECGEFGHFARECPYIYRRDRPRPTKFSRDEPMEVNTVGLRGYRTSSASESDDSFATSSDSGRSGTSYYKRGKNGRGIRRDEWPAMKRETETSKVKESKD